MNDHDWVNTFLMGLLYLIAGLIVVLTIALVVTVVDSNQKMNAGCTLQPTGEYATEYAIGSRGIIQVARLEMEWVCPAQEAE